MTTSTPPAWGFLHGRYVPVEARKTPDSETFSKQNDSDQCDECRCAPGQPHATGCDEAAQLTNAQSNAGPEHVVAESCPECGTVTDIEYETLMAEGYREMAEDSLATAEANLPPDCRGCEPEPARSAIGAGPLFSDGVRFAHETPANLAVGARSEHVPFSVQSWMFESLCEGEIDNLHDLIDDHHDLIIEMARDRFRKGYAKYGSAMYSWSPERRLDETLQEVADSVVYPTSGPLA